MANKGVKVAVFRSRADADNATFQVTVIPTREEWNDFNFRTRAEFGFLTESGRREWLRGRFALKGHEDTRAYFESMGAFQQSHVRASALRVPFASLLDDVKSYSYLRRALDPDRAQTFLRAINDASILQAEGIPGWPELLSSDVFALSMVRSSEAYYAFKNGGHVASGQFTSNDDACTPMSVAMSGSLGTLTFDFPFDSSNSLRGRSAAIVGKNGCGKTHSLAKLASALTDLTSTEVTFQRRPSVNQVIAFAHSSALKFFRSDGSAGTARLRTFSLDPRSRRLKTEPSNAELLVDIVRSHESSTPVLQFLIDTLAREFEGLRMLVPVKERGATVTYPDVASWLHAGEGRRLGLMSDILRTKQLVFRDDSDRPRKLSLGQLAFLRFLLVVLSQAGVASVLFIDEPENFLHPNLISRFMRVLHHVLATTRSIAIVATHSPFVVREVQRSQVNVIRYLNGSLVVAKPRLQTLGSNVASIADEVFGDDLPTHLFEELISHSGAVSLPLHEAIERYSTELSVEALMVLRSKIEGDE